MIPRGDWLARVWYPGESCFGGFCIDSPRYDTPGRKTRQSIIPRGDWLAGVWFPGRLTRQGITPRGDWTIWITRRILKQNWKHFNPMVSGPERFKLWKKTGGRKSRSTVPLRFYIFCVSTFLHAMICKVRRNKIVKSFKLRKYEDSTKDLMDQ